MAGGWGRAGAVLRTRAFPFRVKRTVFPHVYAALNEREYHVPKRREQRLSMLGVGWQSILHVKPAVDSRVKSCGGKPRRTNQCHHHHHQQTQQPPTTATAGSKPSNTSHLRSRLTRLRRESMSEIICMTSWSCRRSSPLLKITCKEGTEKKTRGRGWRRTLPTPDPPRFGSLYRFGLCCGLRYETLGPRCVESTPGF